MVWQELTGHINGNSVWLRSKSGNDYSGKTESDRLNDSIYSQLINDAHDDSQFWAWVEFEDDEAIVKDFSRGRMPEKPPWEY